MPSLQRPMSSLQRPMPSLSNCVPMGCAFKPGMQDCDFDPRQPARYLMTSWPVCDPPAVGSLTLSGLYVLIVEDSWDVGTGLKMLLESWGADVAGPAATTAEARQMISERTPDVALVDINLRDGEQSYCLINQLHDQGIRIVVISGY